MKKENEKILKKILEENRQKVKPASNTNKTIASITAVTLGVILGHKFL